MKKTLLTSAIVSALGIGAMSSPTFAAPILQGNLVFVDGNIAVPANTFTNTTGAYNANTGKYGSTGNVLTADFGLNSNGTSAEFRMVGTDGLPGGGGEKSLVGLRDDGTVGDNGLNTITWTSGAAGTPGEGLIVGSNGDITPGAANSSLGATQGGMTNAVFFGQFFGFALSPTVPVVTDVDYGAMTITMDVGSMEAQWGDQFFPMGECSDLNQASPNYVNPNNTTKNLSDGQGCGIHFAGTISNVSPGGNFDFVLFGEHRVTPYEDTEGNTAAAAGFAGWNAQFGLSGSFAVPVPAAVWLFGSGLLGLVGVARRKKVA